MDQHARDWLSLCEKMGNGDVEYNPEYYLIDSTQEGGSSDIHLVTPTQAQVDQAKSEMKRKIPFVNAPPTKRRKAAPKKKTNQKGGKKKSTKKPVKRSKTKRIVKKQSKSQRGGKRKPAAAKRKPKKKVNKRYK